MSHPNKSYLWRKIATKRWNCLDIALRKSCFQLEKNFVLTHVIDEFEWIMRETKQPNHFTCTSVETLSQSHLFESQKICWLQKFFFIEWNGNFVCYSLKPIQNLRLYLPFVKNFNKNKISPTLLRVTVDSWRLSTYTHTYWWQQANNPFFIFSLFFVNKNIRNGTE